MWLWHLLKRGVCDTDVVAVFLYPILSPFIFLYFRFSFSKVLCRQCDSICRFLLIFLCIAIEHVLNPWRISSQWEIWRTECKTMLFRLCASKVVCTVKNFLTVSLLLRKIKTKYLIQTVCFQCISICTLAHTFTSENCVLLLGWMYKLIQPRMNSGIRECRDVSECVPAARIQSSLWNGWCATSESTLLFNIVLYGIHKLARMDVWMFVYMCLGY